MNKYIFLIVLLLIPVLAFAKDYNTYLDETIDFTDSTRVCSVIDKLQEGDILYIKISSNGGLVNAGDKIRAAITKTKGTVIAVIRGEALSEAAFVAIACHKIQGNGSVMFHLGFDLDEQGNMKPPHPSVVRKTIRALRSILSRKELVRLKDGQDIVMSVSELKKRTGK